jgi:Predicted membrane protein
MSERRSLHPLYLLISVIGAVRGFIPVVAIVLLRGVNWEEALRWYWIAGAAALLLVFVGFSYLQWRKFGFWLEEDRIVIRRGILFRDEKTIYYTRIHSVNVEQPLMHRLLRVAKLKIETPGGGKQADGYLDVLSMAEANRIKSLLRDKAGQTGTAQAGRMEPDRAGAGPAAGEASGTAAAAGGHTVPEDAGAMRTAEVSAPQLPGGVMEKESGVYFRLDTAKLLQAAATSLNFGLVAAFVAGLISFADDFIDLLLPEHYWEHVVEDSMDLMPGSMVVAIGAIIIILFAWLLSLVLYIVKYSGFEVRREGGQIALSYGLLEKKSFLFEPKKVQAVLISESLLRQPFGYGEIKLQVISSDKQEQLMLHPFIKLSRAQELIDEFVPQMKLHAADKLAPSPRRALLYYVRTYLLIAAAVCAVCIGWFGTPGVWSLLLIPLVFWWRVSCHRSAGMLLEGGQLALRKRLLNRTTYYVRRPTIQRMKVRRSRAQRRKGLISLSVHALGSPIDYSAACLDEADVEAAWRWYSRSMRESGRAADLSS